MQHYGAPEKHCENRIFICEKQMVFQKSKKSKWFLKSRTARNRSTLLSPDNLILQEGAGRVKQGNCNQNQSGN